MIPFPSFGDTKIEEVFGKPHRKAAEITIAYVSTSFLDSFLASGHINFLEKLLLCSDEKIIAIEAKSS